LLETISHDRLKTGERRPVREAVLDKGPAAQRRWRGPDVRAKRVVHIIFLCKLDRNACGWLAFRRYFRDTLYGNLPDRQHRQLIYSRLKILCFKRA